MNGDRHSVVEWGWDGHELRTLDVGADIDCCATVSLSPDGTRLLVLGAKTGGRILDLEGRLLAHGHTIRGSWADDSRHLCSLQPHTQNRRLPDGPADLVLVDPGRATHVIAQVPGYGPHTGPKIMRCSVTRDEAIVVENTLATNVSVTRIRISDGSVSTPHWAPSIRDAEVVAVSGNGKYVLEQSRSNSSGPRGVVVATTTGRTVGHTDGAPRDLSWDGHIALETVVSTLQLQAVDWRDHTSRWQSTAGGPNCPCPMAGYVLSTRPRSDDLALAASSQPAQPFGQAALWLVAANHPQLLATAVRLGLV